MRLIQPHFAEIVIVIVQNGDFVLLLQQFDLEIPENIWHRLRHALIVRVGKGEAGERDLTVSADDCRRARLEHRIAVIADQESTEPVAPDLWRTGPGPETGYSHPTFGCA